MPDFDSGVTNYIHGQAIVDVYFPVDAKGNADVCCRQCYYFRTSSNSCALNGEVCAYPNKYVGANCPLKIKEEI
jgi:hypothetical protein